jgi:hypothetical protein
MLEHILIALYNIEPSGSKSRLHNQPNEFYSGVSVFDASACDISFCSRLREIRLSSRARRVYIMSAPSASGLRSQSTSAGSTPQPHPSLPARPPPPVDPTPTVPVNYGASSRASRPPAGNAPYSSAAWEPSQAVNGTAYSRCRQDS